MDSKYRIYDLIRCEEDTPRVEADFDIDSILSEVQTKLLSELATQTAVPIETLPKIQREVQIFLRDLSRNPQIDRRCIVDLLKALKRPLPHPLLRDLQAIYSSYKEHPSRLLDELLKFVEDYQLQENQEPLVSVGEPIKEEEIELVVYMTLS
ncbi:hypothetical protein [Thermus oshimai]